MRHGKLLLLLALLALPLTVQAQERTPTALPMPTTTAVPTVIAQAVGETMISLGDSVTDQLTMDMPAQVYTFNGKQGDSVLITLVSDAVDTYLVLEDESGDEITRDDDSGGSGDARIGPFVLPESGTYRIIAQSFSYAVSSTPTEGEFTLSVTSFTPRRIEYTQEVDGELTDEMLTAYYSFSGQAGDEVVIRLNSDDFDSYLTLSDAAGEELTTNDDGGGSLNSLIGPYALPETGSYLIQARSLSGTATGAYTLTLDRADVMTLEYGESAEVELSEEDNTAYFAFEGVRSDAITVTVNASNNLDTSLQLNSPFNYEEFSNDDGGEGLNPAIDSFVLTQDGRYIVILSAPFGGSGTAEVTLERAELPSLDEGMQSVTFGEERTTRALVFTAEANTSYRLTLNLVDGETGAPSVEIQQDDTSIASMSAYSVTQASLEFTTETEGLVTVQLTDYSYGDTLEYEVSLRKVE